MKVIEFLDKYTFVFSFAYSVIGFLVGIISKKILGAFKRYKIRKCLSLKKEDCKIVLPSYDKKLHNRIDIIPMCPIGDMKAVSNVIDLIYKTELYSRQESIFYEDGYSISFDNYNIFCVGGSLANSYSYNLFQQFFPRFKICATSEKISTNPNKIPESHFEVNEYNGFCWGNYSPDEHFLVESDERYAIIVKLTDKDFNIKNHGTIHILFGNAIEGTIAISKYLLNNYEDLYQRVKNQDHYFIAFKLKHDTGLIDTNSFVDLTNEMFAQN